MLPTPIDQHLYRQTCTCGQLVIPKYIPPPDMQHIGFLTHERFKETYALYGTTTGRRYEYYCALNGSQNKIPLCTPRDRNLWNGDKIEIPGRHGTWRVTLYEPRVPVCF